MEKLSFTRCRLALSKRGIKLTKAFGEYGVNYVNGKLKTKYYTDDLQDALNTAERMIEHKKKQEVK